MKKIGVISLGCSKNTVDTEMLLGKLVKHGNILTEKLKEAQVLIVNTCGFIDSAKKESADTILELLEYKKKKTCETLIVMGCFSQRYGDKLKTDIPEIDLIVGSGDFNSVLGFLKTGRKKKGKTAGNILVKKPVFEVSGYSGRVPTTPFYSSYIKISEGCSNKCSYCVIPLLRGPQKSRPINSILHEVKKFVADGVLEVNLIAQNTTSYAKDLRLDDGLIKLVNEIANVPDLRWIRVMYSHSAEMSKNYVKLFKSVDKLCRYVDMPIQHIHNEILKKMNRTDTEDTIRKTINLLRKSITGVTLRTTFIVGFPSETEEHFNYLCDFVKEVRFDHVGVFKYSHEEGTSAYKMIDDVTAEIKEDRFCRLMEIQREISAEKNRKKIGSVFDVLVENVFDEDENRFVGRLNSQAPEVDGIVFLDNCREEFIGGIKKVKLTDSYEYDLVGRIL